MGRFFLTDRPLPRYLQIILFFHPLNFSKAFIEEKQLTHLFHPRQFFKRFIRKVLWKNLGGEGFSFRAKDCYNLIVRQKMRVVTFLSHFFFQVVSTQEMVKKTYEQNNTKLNKNRHLKNTSTLFFYD